MEDFLIKLLYDSEEAIKNGNLNYKFFLYSSLLILLFQTILILVNLYGSKNKKIKSSEIKEFRKSVFFYNFYYFLISIGINSILILLIKSANSVIFSPIMSFVLSKYITDNIFKLKINELKGNSSKKEDSKKEDEKVPEKNSNNSNTVNNDININIVNNNNNEDEIILPYFNPNTHDIKIPEGYTIKTLDLVTILELYGYISPNQKYKMISSSIFDLPEDQIPKLLDMYVLTEEELKEAKVILNLIKLKGKLVTKEEALKYIFENELEEHNKNKKEEK